MVWTSSIFDYFLYLQPNRSFFKQPYFNKIIQLKNKLHIIAFFRC